MDQGTPQVPATGTAPTSGQRSAPAATGAAQTRSGIRSKVGRVVSDKMQKTIVVEIEVLKRHPLYRKTLRRSVKFKAHDEHEKAKAGDLVRIVECRKMSKDKYYRLAEILEQREAPINVVQEVKEA